MYGDSAVSDATRLIRSKRRARNVLHYVDPHLEVRDRTLAKILADHDSDDPRPSQIWILAKAATLAPHM